MQHGNPQRNFDVRLLDGQWVRIAAGREADAPIPAFPNYLIIQLLTSLGLVAAAAAAAVMIAVRQATRPLQQLAQAADARGRDLDATPSPRKVPPKPAEPNKPSTECKPKSGAWSMSGPVLWQRSRTICARR